ncbi:MAG: hypothetical protein AVDCRST_MAG53-1290, partial [uncultured Solirubrobacteraceae bacterium]
ALVEEALDVERLLGEARPLGQFRFLLRRSSTPLRGMPAHQRNTSSPEAGVAATRTAM